MMTVSNQTNKIRYSGNGSSDEFSFPFKIFSESDLEVYLIDTDDDSSEIQTINTDYTVEINDSSDGGTVTFDTPPASGFDVLIKRVIALTQPTDLPAVSNFAEQSVENELDRAAMRDAQLQEQIDRCIKFPATSENEDISLPEPEALQYLRWNTDADAIENGTPASTATDYPGTFTYGLDSAKAASPSTGDIYFAIDTNKFYKCISGGTWTTATNFADAVSMSGAAFNFAKGADIASANTIDLGAATGNFPDITGSTTINALGTAAAGTARWVRFAGALQLTHNGTSLILPTGANITTAAGDCALFVSLGSGNWRCFHYQKANGQALAGGLQVKVGSFTRDISLAGGTQAVTGVGFQPKAVIFISSIAGSTGVISSVGLDSSLAAFALIHSQAISANTFYLDSDSSIVPVTGSGPDRYEGNITALESDGFTITWTKTGSPTGTITVAYLAIG